MAAVSERSRREPYIGETKKSQRDGHGSFEYSNKFFRYEGQWKNGKKHGHGKLVMTDGSYYEGSFKDGEIDGFGFRYFADSGAKYQGQFRLGELHGKGRMIWPDGSIYEGDFVHNRRQGFGAMKSVTENLLYKGGYFQNKRHGQGTMIYPLFIEFPSSVESKGELYNGDWVMDKRHGKGDMKYDDGSMYEGQFEEDYFSGEGVLKHCSGLVHSGVWINGHPGSTPVKLVIIHEKDPLELEQGQTFEIHIECRDENDQVVKEEHGRELQITLGYKNIKPKKGSALFDMIEDVAEKPIQTPYGYEVVSYPLTNQSEDLTDKQEENDDDRESKVVPRSSSDITKGSVMHRDSISLIQKNSADIVEEDEEMADGDVNDDTEKVEPIAEETTDGPVGNHQGRDATGNTQEPGHSVSSSFTGNARDKDDKEAIPLPPQVPNHRTEAGECHFKSLFIPPPPPMYRPFVALDEDNKKSKEKQDRMDALDVGYKRSVAGYLQAKRHNKEKIDDARIARTGDYVLMVRDVTNPPFLERNLDPAFLLIKLKKPKREKVKKEPKPNPFMRSFAQRRNLLEEADEDDEAEDSFF
ncbi:hypothetical protein CHS0354_017421 [Potamilus streckersoni]|uniref:MORN repeat-containing protein 1 n=1 Tax=Potamilus streckersoni TaxID=2493646 RepID=A0AAE0SCD4_9BIVA|nr:hypothetical protein CHS0354_017421 [Potamilus streckersoni]